ncbi:shikimate dehydrogenase [Rubrivirga sp. IMCC43871]|uniref:shikimate dehydrogenase n=1 Tax=Rubrivirga sp. IMCC43871 TaxID=3391575 RepID=UPI00398F9ED6
MASARDGAITARTRLAVLLGDPVGHSLSPTIHNAAFQAQGIDAVYLACAVEAGRLASAVEGLAALGALGANVTIPHKQTALALAGEATPTARALGAANTLVRTEAGWRADNTDVAGFLTPLDAHRQRLAGASVVVLGAGGAARAVVYAALAELGARVTIAARRREQGEALAADLRAVGPVAVTGLDDTAAIRDATLVVNATPLGMGGERMPVDASALHAGQIVYDLVYRPAVTPLLAAAQAAGGTTIGGLPMLLGQAAASYRQWTGRDFPLDTACRAALAALDQ